MLSDNHYEIVISVTGHIMTSLCHNRYALVQKIVYLLSFLVCFITVSRFKLGFFVKLKVHQYNDSPNFSSRS